MNKNKFLFIVLLAFSTQVKAQISFEQILPPSPLPQNIANFITGEHAVYAVGDIDNDGDLDLFVSVEKRGTNTEFYSGIYRNDGNGNFDKDTNNIIAISRGTASFVDIDNDGDLDLFVAGVTYNYYSSGTAKMYLNDGNGNFTLQTGTSFQNERVTDAKFADLNGDGYQDLLFSKYDIPIELYLNDGNGNLTHTSSNINDHTDSIQIFDFDGDNDDDILITVAQDRYHTIFEVKLFRNDGGAFFTQIPSSGFDLMYDSMSSSVGDIDNDGDLDIVFNTSITDNFHSNSAFIYLNDGIGHFHRDQSTSLNTEDNLGVRLVDLNNDNHLDIFVTSGTIFRNFGNLNFVSYHQDLEITKQNNVLFFDANNDGYQDFILGGKESYDYYYDTSLYMNNGVGNFNMVTGTPLNIDPYYEPQFVDFDNDGKIDIVIKTQNFYKNYGNNIFREVYYSNLDISQLSSSAFTDYDNDGDKDLIIAHAHDNFLDLYKNDGYGNFTFDTYYQIDAMDYPYLSLGDIDNDGDEDIIVTGGNNQNANFLRNEGNGTYFKIAMVGTENSFPFVYLKDLNNNGNLEVILSESYRTQIFTIDSFGNANLVTGNNFMDKRARVAFGDLDNDGDLDMIMTKMAPGTTATDNTVYYENTGNLHFVAQNIGLPNYQNGGSDVKIADLDNDHDLDIILVGRVGISLNETNVLENTGNGSFTRVTNCILPDINGFVYTADLNNDNKLDLLLTGKSFHHRITHLFSNTNTNMSIANNDKNPFEIYPNPTNAILNIQLESPTDVAIKIYDLSGKLVYENTYNNQQNILINPRLAKGFYLIRLILDNKTFTKKIIVK